MYFNKCVNTVMFLLFYLCYFLGAVIDLLLIWVCVCVSVCVCVCVSSLSKMCEINSICFIREMLIRVGVAKINNGMKKIENQPRACMLKQQSLEIKCLITKCYKIGTDLREYVLFFFNCAYMICKYLIVYAHDVAPLFFSIYH